MLRLALEVGLLGLVVLHGQTLPPSPPSPRDRAQPVTSGTPAGTAAIRGRVIAADGGAPLRNVRINVTLGGESIDPTGTFEPVLTDAEGRFQVANLPAGRYTVFASKAGYVSTRFGARTAFERPLGVALTDGDVVQHVDVRLVKGAAISGRLVDDVGDPAIGATVAAARLTRVDGRERVSLVTSTQTDDLGEYRLFDLPPGRLIVTAGGGGGRATRWARTFFPGTVNLSRAQPLTLAAGEEVVDRDFAVSPVGIGRSPAKMTGLVVDAQGAPAVGVLIDLTVDEVAGFSSSSSRQIPPNGEFSVVAEAGDHLLIAQGPGGAVAATRIPVGDADVTALRLVLSNGGRVTGRVTFEGSHPPAASDVELEAWSPDLAGGITLGPQTQALLATRKANRDGSFEFAGLFGTRELAVRTAPRGWSVTSITVDGRSLADVPIDFDRTRELIGVEIVLTDRVTRLTGSVIDSNGRPLEEYSVLVVPADASQLRYPSRVAQWVRPDQTGRFTVDGLRPGSYLAVAVDEVDDGAWLNADYLERLRPLATGVTLMDGEKRTLTLQRVTVP